MAELCKVNRDAVPRRSITVFTNSSMMPSHVLCTYLYMIGKQRLKSKRSAFKFLRIFAGAFQRAVTSDPDDHGGVGVRHLACTCSWWRITIGNSQRTSSLRSDGLKPGGVETFARVSRLVGVRPISTAPALLAAIDNGRSCARRAWQCHL